MRLAFLGLERDETQEIQWYIYLLILVSITRVEVVSMVPDELCLSRRVDKARVCVEDAK